MAYNRIINNTTTNNAIIATKSISPVPNHFAIDWSDRAKDESEKISEEKSSFTMF